MTQFSVRSVSEVAPGSDWRRGGKLNNHTNQPATNHCSTFNSLDSLKCFKRSKKRYIGQSNSSYQTFKNF